MTIKMTEKKKKHAGGRPPLFKTPKDLQDKINAYFDDCKNNKATITDKNGVSLVVDQPLIPTIAGLAYELGTDRQTIYNYADKDEFFDTIKKAREFIISRIERKLANENGNIAGTIFLSKNYGYTDKQEIEFTKPLEVIISDYRGKE